MQITSDKLTTIATAVQTVEAVATQAAAVLGTAPTGAQKLQAAVQVASALDPTVAQWAVPVETLIGAVVGIFNLFGAFKHNAAPGAS